MTRSKLKKLKKHISRINFDYIEQEETCIYYRENSGEYSALTWLRHWLNQSRAMRKVAEPIDLVSSLLSHSAQLNKHNIDYIYTLLPYC